MKVTLVVCHVLSELDPASLKTNSSSMVGSVSCFWYRQNKPFKWLIQQICPSLYVHLKWAIFQKLSLSSVILPSTIWYGSCLTRCWMATSRKLTFLIVRILPPDQVARSCRSLRSYPSSVVNRWCATGPFVRVPHHRVIARSKCYGNQQITPN